MIQSMRYIKFLIFLLLFIGLNSCRRNYPPMNEYQVVGFVPIDSLEVGRIFVLDSELIVLYSSQNDASVYDRMRKYNLSNPVKPELTDEIRLTETLPEPLLSQYNKFLIFSIADLNTIKILDFYDNRVHDMNLGFRPLAIASKDSFMFILADSCLTGWNIADFSNPVMIYRDSVLTGFTRGMLAINDTLLFAYLNNYSFKLWNIKLPSQPQLISTGALGYGIPIKIIFNNRNLFIADLDPYGWWRIRYFTINDSGKVGFIDGFSPNERLNDFLVDRDTIYMLMDDRLTVSDITTFDFLLRIEVPLPTLVSRPNFVNYNNFVYILARNKGVVIYKRTEEQ